MYMHVGERRVSQSNGDHQGEDQQSTGREKVSNLPRNTCISTVALGSWILQQPPLGKEVLAILEEWPYLGICMVMQLGPK